MPSDALPNNAMSNISLLFAIPLATALALKVKRCLCDSYRRGPRHLAVDRLIIVINNLLAFSLFVMWASSLSGSSVCHLERLVVVDVLVIVHVQRYALNLLFRFATDRYHEPGELALMFRKRRVKLSIIITVISCSACAAVSALTEQYYPSSSLLELSNQSGSDFWFFVLLLPSLHAVLRAIVLDTPSFSRSRQEIRAEAEFQVQSETTNSFTITDEEDEDNLSLDDYEGTEADMSVPDTSTPASDAQQDHEQL